MISDHRSMQALDSREAAIKAIVHVLGRIRDHSGVGWYLGHGTESFALLTEALAMLDDCGPNILELRTDFSPVAPKDPAEDSEERERPRRFFEEEREVLREIAAHHEHMAAALTQAAALAGQQTSFGLLQQAERHDRYSDEISSIVAGGGPR